MPVLRAVGAFFQFSYDFIVGDDWTVAALVVAALVITALMQRGNIVSWWVVPLIVIIATWNSLRRWAARNST